MILQVDRTGTFEQRGDALIGLIDRPSQKEGIAYFDEWLKVYHPKEKYDVLMAKCGCEYYYHFADFTYHVHEPTYL